MTLFMIFLQLHSNVYGTFFRISLKFMRFFSLFLIAFMMRWWVTTASNVSLSDCIVFLAAFVGVDLVEDIAHSSPFSPSSPCIKMIMETVFDTVEYRPIVWDYNIGLHIRPTF